MARCIFCDEWAGADAGWHDSCLREFTQNMNDAGLIRRALAKAVRTAFAALAVVTGLFSAQPIPARTPSIKTQSSSSSPLSLHPETASDAQTVSLPHSDSAATR